MCVNQLFFCRQIEFILHSSGEGGVVKEEVSLEREVRIRLERRYGILENKR